MWPYFFGFRALFERIVVVNEFGSHTYNEAHYTESETEISCATDDLLVLFSFLLLFGQTLFFRKFIHDE